MLKRLRLNDDAIKNIGVMILNHTHTLSFG